LLNTKQGSSNQQIQQATYKRVPNPKGNADLAKYAAIGQHAATISRRKWPAWKRHMHGWILVMKRWHPGHPVLAMTRDEQKQIFQGAFQHCLNIKGGYERL